MPRRREPVCDVSDKAPKFSELVKAQEAHRGARFSAVSSQFASSFPRRHTIRTADIIVRMQLRIRRMYNRND